MNLGRGAGANLVALAVSHLVGAVAGIVVARRLGPEGVGALALVFGLVAVLHPLAAFMSSPSVIQHAKMPSVPRVFGTSLALKLATSAALFFALAALARPVGSLLEVPPLLVVVAGAGFLGQAGYEVALNRLEAENRLVARSLVLPIGPAVYLVIVVLLVQDVVGAAAATLAGSVAMSLVALPHLRKVRPRVDPEVARFLWRIGSRLLVGDLLLLSLLWFDTFAVNFLLDKAEAGIYQTAFNLAMLLLVGATVLEIALVPLLAQARVRGAALSDAYHAGNLLALGLGALAVVLILPVGPFLLGLYGPAFVPAYPALVVLVVMAGFGALFFPVKAVLAAVERPEITMRILALELLVSVPLIVLLTPRMGILGTSLAMLAAFATGTLVGWALVRRETGMMPFPAVREWGRVLARAR